MAANYLPYDPQQMLLLPEALQEWLPEGHLAYFIIDAVDGLDLSAFHARYDKDGPRNQPFHPAMMVKVLVYGYATGVFSSRKIARKLHEDVAFRVLAGGEHPHFTTVNEFRLLHREARMQPALGRQRFEAPEGGTLFLQRKEGRFPPKGARDPRQETAPRIERCSSFTVAAPGVTLLGIDVLARAAHDRERLRTRSRPRRHGAP